MPYQQTNGRFSIPLGLSAGRERDPVKLSVFLRAGLCLGTSLLLPVHGWAADSAKASVAAARENNTGVALMNQQLLAKALAHFEEAHKADPTAIIPMLNKSLALIYLRRLPEADATLETLSATAPSNPRVWYSLGLSRFEAGNQEQALGDFQRAAELDPSDADSHYYVATVELALKDYTHAIEEFQKAIELSPLHASAQYGLARALQRTGMTAESRAHLQRFQEITQSKVGILFSMNYGEQGRYAIVQDMLAPPAAVGPMIPLKFVPATQVDAAPKATQSRAIAGAGACIFDVEGNGHKAIVSLGNGENAIHVYRVTAAGSTEEISAQETGLTLAGQGVSCAVGDYDNDGLPDLAVAMNDRVEVFHNLGHGKFANYHRRPGHTSAESARRADLCGLRSRWRSRSLHHRSVLVCRLGPSVLWRNNGNSTFTEWTAPTALAGTAEHNKRNAVGYQQRSRRGSGRLARTLRPRSTRTSAKGRSSGCRCTMTRTSAQPAACWPSTSIKMAGWT